MTSEVDLARKLVLGTIAWRNGDAVLTPVFQDPPTLASLDPGLAPPFRDRGVTVVVSPEARGFVVGSLCASSLGVGFLAARKAGGVHADEKLVVTSEPDWRGRRVEFALARTLGPIDRVLIVDDWIETGSQATAIAGAVAQMGAMVVGTSVIVDQTTTDVRSALQVVGLLDFGELPGHD